MQLDEYRVGDLATVYYIPDYLSVSEESRLLKEIYAAPVTKWKVMKNRRLQDWGGVVHEKGLISQSIPPWLAALTERLHMDMNLFPSPANHVLVNEYLPGQGIMAHQDGPLYFPVVAIVSTGAPTLMRFSPHLRHSPTEAPPEPLSKPPTASGSQVGAAPEGVRGRRQGVRSIVLMPRSLLIFKDEAYTEYLHAIEDREEDVLDSTVMNMDSVRRNLCPEDACLASDDSAMQERVAENSSDDNVFRVHDNNVVVKRVGTRVSLTCRVVLKVKPKLLRL